MILLAMQNIFYPSHLLTFRFGQRSLACRYSRGRLSKRVWQSSQQRGMKLQRKNAGGRKGEQLPYHFDLHSKPLSVQSAVVCVHQESVSTATNECARIDHHPSQKPCLQEMSHYHEWEGSGGKRTIKSHEAISMDT